MKLFLKTLIFGVLILFQIKVLKAQEEVDFKPLIDYDNGLGIVAPDTSYYINFRFRMQNRMGLFTKSIDDLNVDEVEARVRRLRLRMDGFLISPKFSYYIQLSFSRGDQDWDNSQVPNVVRDALVFYFVNDNLYFGFGQSKLPGNRQRVISSGMQQFVDRSIVNATLNIDRDFGIRAFYENKIGDKSIYKLQAAVTSGEGRNALNSDNGLAYTGRVEFLPFGGFTNNGDYFEGDLAREKKPKLSLGSSYSYNQKARRTGAQIGNFISSPVDISTFIADFMFKYNGFAMLGEFVNRTSSQKIVTDANLGLPTYIFNGGGANLQMSYLLPSNFEVATRYAYINSAASISDFNKGFNEMTLGLTKYFKDHRIKFQSNLAYLHNHESLNNGNGRWALLFQFEVGI